MAPIVWTKTPVQSRAEGLIATLRRIGRSQAVLVPGWQAEDVRGHMRAARRGTEKWFVSKTTMAGAWIVREQ